MVEQPPERFTILLRQPGKGDGVHLVECAALFLYERLCSFGGIQPVAALVVCVSTLFEKTGLLQTFCGQRDRSGRDSEHTRELLLGAAGVANDRFHHGALTVVERTSGTLFTKQIAAQNIQLYDPSAKRVVMHGVPPLVTKIKINV